MRELRGAGRSAAVDRPVAGVPAALTTPWRRRLLGHWVVCWPGHSASRSSERYQEQAQGQAQDPVQEQFREPAQAPTVLLLNGCGLGAASWQKVVDGLAGHRVIAVDRPAYQGGDSAPPPSLPGLTRLVSRLLQEVAAGPVVVVAHSMAAFQAEALARLHPEQVAGVVLVDPSMLSRRLLRPLSPRTARRASSLVRLALHCPPVQVIAAGGWRVALRWQTRDPQAVVVEPWAGTWAGPEALADAAAQWLSFGGQVEALWQLRARQKRSCQVPAVVLEAPPVPTSQQVTVLADAFRTLRRRRVPGSRHLLMLDAPQVVVAEVKRLLQAAS